MLEESAVVAGAEMFISVAELPVTGVAITGPAASGALAFVVGVESPGGSTGAAGVTGICRRVEQKELMLQWVVAPPATITS